jgi:hypothetical protein
MRNAKRGGRYVKQVLRLGMVAFLVVSSTGFALAQDPDPTEEPMPTGDRSLYVTEAAAPRMAVASSSAAVDYSEDRSYVIAWDTSNGADPATNDNHSSLYNELSSYYTVRTINITEEGITDDVDTLVITTLRNRGCITWPTYGYKAIYGSGYDGDERDTDIANFVSAGHGLLLLGEHGDASMEVDTECGFGTSPIATALGETWFGGGYLANHIFTEEALTPPGGFPTEYHYGSFNKGAFPTLFEGVDWWFASYASPYITTNDANVAVWNDSEPERPMVIAKDFGDGCAVIVGDSDWAADWVIGDPIYPYNLTLAMNAFEYLKCGNEPPVADPGGPYLGAASLEIVFDGTGSSDPDGDPLTYAWNFGDGNTGTGESPSHTYEFADIYYVCLIVNDGTDDSAEVCTQAFVGDPSDGWVKGRGTIDSPPGAYKPDPTLAGEASFVFDSRYKKGAVVPTGKTSFTFEAAPLVFESFSYDWLFVAGGSDASVKGAGTGTFNDQGEEYMFMILASDSETDTFQIKIWDEDEFGNETLIYENGIDQPIASGSIAIHGYKP